MLQRGVWQQSHYCIRTLYCFKNLSHVLCNTWLSLSFFDSTVRTAVDPYLSAIGAVVMRPSSIKSVAVGSVAVGAQVGV